MSIILSGKIFLGIKITVKSPIKKNAKPIFIFKGNEIKKKTTLIIINNNPIILHLYEEAGLSMKILLR